MKFFRVLCVFFFLFAFLLCSAQEIQNNGWTRFRGSDGMGVDPGGLVPVKWDSAAYAWEVSLPGVGHSSPVIWDSIIFVTSSDPSNQMGFVLALDERDGSILWQKEIKLSELTMHVDNNLASSTPAVDASHVYHIWYAKEKIALTALAHDGEVQWHSEFDGIEARHGGGSSLVLTENAVVFTREQEEGSSFKSSWVAVEKSTGHTLWELDRNSCTRNSFSTPLLAYNDRQEARLIFTSEAHGFTILDPETGLVLGENRDILTHRVVASPIYADGRVLGCRKGKAMLLEMDLNTHQVADSALYSLPPNLSPYVPTPLIFENFIFLFMDNGSIACIRLDSGELLWKERPAGPLYGSPVCVDGKLYCISKAGKVLVIQANANYELLGINDLGEGSFSSPAMCNSGMLFRSFSKLKLLPKNLTP